MATPYQERKMRDPTLNPGDQPYFDAAAEGKLMLKKCGDCGQHHHYPRALCPFCMSDATAWLEVQGTGSIYSFSTVRQKNGAFVIAFVTLDEGISILTHVVDCDPEQVAIGLRVRMLQRELSDQTVPVFQLLS